MYNLFKIAGLRDFLQSLNIQKDVISFIESLDGKIAGKLVNELKKNPNLTIPELQETMNSFEDKKREPTEFEQEIINIFTYNGEMNKYSNWVMIQLFKLRNSSNSKNIDYGYEPNLLIRMFHEIQEWYMNNQNIDIFSYNFQRAYQLYETWRDTNIGKGSGKIYEPTNPENIVYGPTWDNQEFNGWTIQLVTSRNDLLVEGHKMNHCVSGYSGEVKKGNAIIYSFIKRSL
jgi:hypothetical protein